MTFDEWLKAISTYHLDVGKDHAMREFVTGMHKRGLVYHWDDDAADCLMGKVTQEQANIINEIVKELYCEDMFILAIQLHNEED